MPEKVEKPSLIKLKPCNTAFFSPRVFDEGEKVEGEADILSEEYESDTESLDEQIYESFYNGDLLAVNTTF